MVAQLEKLQADMEALREQRESTICSTREELYSAQEEVLRQPRPRVRSKSRALSVNIVSLPPDSRPATRHGGGHSGPGAGDRRPAGRLG